MHSDAYVPETLIAVGPAAKVYRGVEVATGRKVLIKVLLPEHEAANPLDREQIQLLAPLLMQIRHPQVAGLVTMLLTEDEFALVYDYLPALSGQKLPHERQLSQLDLGALATQLLQAILAGEHWRTPHGDLKPSNLIVADHPAGGFFLQIQDWALDQTRTLAAQETLAFRAPERLQGGATTTASELFTAAATLLYWATGVLATQSEDHDQILEDWQHFDSRAMLRKVRPDLDQALVDWLGWLLQLNPAQRPARARTALAALTTLLQKNQLAWSSEPSPKEPLPVQKTKPAAAASPPPPHVRTNREAAVAHSPTVPASSYGCLKVLLALLLNAGALAVIIVCWAPDFKVWLKSLPTRWVQIQSEATIASSQATILPPTPEPMSLLRAPGPPSIEQGRGVMARYVRVSLADPGVLNLVEVQVFSGAENIAPRGIATQSSTYNRGPAHRAIDGSLDSGFSQTSSKATDPPWWQLDFGTAKHITQISVWNRTGKYATRLKNFTLTALDVQEKPVWQTTIAKPPMSSLSLPIQP